MDLSPSGGGPGPESQSGKLPHGNQHLQTIDCLGKHGGITCGLPAKLMCCRVQWRCGGSGPWTPE